MGEMWARCRAGVGEMYRRYVLLREHDLLGGLRVGGEETPVDVAAVAQVGVVAVLGGESEDVEVKASGGRCCMVQ